MADKSSSRTGQRARFGVRARLWGTIAILAVLPVASAVVAWRAFQAFDSALSDVTDAKLPQMEGALLLARDGDRLVLSGAGLAAATTAAMRKTQQDLVAAGVKRAEQEVAQLRTLGLPAQQTQSTEAALRRLQENIAQVDRIVGERLETGVQLGALQQSVLALGDRFSRALEPISAEQRNTMSGFISTLGGTPDADRRADAVDGLQSVADATRALGRLGAANATLQSTIAQVPLAPDGAALDRLMQVIRRDTATLAAALDDLDEKSSKAITPLVDEWDRLGKANPTNLRRRQLELASQLQTMVATNTDLSNALSTEIEASVQRTKTDAGLAAAEARRLTGASRSILIGVVSVALLLAASLSWLVVGRGVMRRLTQVEQAMRRLAGGDLNAALPRSAGDEIGAMVDALAVLKEGAIERRRLETEQEAQRARAEAEKRASLIGMAETIETEMTGAMEQIGARTSAMAETADGMRASAARAGSSAESAAGAAAQALANAQTVASAAEELAASIREIGGQVSQSSAVVGRAVEAGRSTRATIEALNEQVGRIGTVADMIGEIAGKTNLLALNATIEAARAGDAGKGFAVVASEVKQLATQTARSTEEISRHIGQVRAATSASVAAVAHIEQTIGEIDSISNSIAAAVEEQQAATAEIARNVSETAAATTEMTRRIGEVSTEAVQTGQHAAEVHDGTKVLVEAVNELRHSVIHIVRTSTEEVDRRKAVRHEIDLPCQMIDASGSHAARITNLSSGGATVTGAPTLAPGSQGTLSGAALGVSLSFTVRASNDEETHLAFVLNPETAAKFRPVLDRLMPQQAA